MSKLLLTKTLLMKGIQCPKQLWLYINSPELAIEDGNNRFKIIGNELGELARNHYKNGVLIAEKNPLKALEETNEALKTKGILFEPAFLFENLYFRADILLRSNNGFSIIEYKTSTEIKEYHKQDLAIQAYILTKCGHKIDKLKLAYIDKKYTTALPDSSLFIIEEVTEEILALFPWVENQIKTIKSFMKKLEEPNLDIGPHCNKPFECPFKNYCRKQKDIPEVSVLNFPYLNTKWELYKKGKVKISDLKESDLKTDGQKQTLKKLNQIEPYLDKVKIKDILSTWKSPIYFLDFETVSFGLPPYLKTHPFQEIPFQFSCYSIKRHNDRLEHESSYLSPGLDKDPRIELAKALLNTLGKKGSIVSYNASFEKKVIEHMAETLPKYKKDLLELNKRIVDLLPIMKDFVYYKEFNLSWSIKSVIPAIFGQTESYDNMKISNGLKAQSAFMEAVNNGTLDLIKQDLIDYCNKDVLEMVRLYNHLRTLK